MEWNSLTYLKPIWKILLNLTPNKSRFVLMSDKNDAKYRFKIHCYTLLVRRIKFLEASKLAFQSTIEGNHQVLRYSLCHVKMESKLLTSGSSNFEFYNQFFGHIPNCLTLCTVENRSMYVCLKRILSISSTIISNLLQSLLTVMHWFDWILILTQEITSKLTSHSMLVDYHDFGNGTMSLVFDLTARGECSSEQFTIKKLGNLHINLKYKNASHRDKQFNLVWRFWLCVDHLCRSQHFHRLLLRKMKSR